MKEAFYFPHDNNAHNDPKLMTVFMKTWLSWVWLYWILVELLHQQNDWRIKKEEYDHYIKWYTSNENKWTAFVEQVLNIYITSELFFLDDDWYITSKRVLENKKYREELSEKRSEAWKKSALARQKSTSVEQNWTSVEQGKEKKGKERKRNNTDTLPTVIEQALVTTEKIDKRNPWTQRIIDIIQSEIQDMWYLYEKNAQDRNRATIISKRQSDWWEFVKDSPEAREEQIIRQIINYSNSNEFVKKIRSTYDFHEKWKSVANAMKQSISQIPESRTF
jgi:hypothetical protein